MTISQIVERKFKNTKDKSLLFASDFSVYNQNYIADPLSRLTISLKDSVNLKKDSTILMTKKDI